jgi:hypothetical protein
MKDDVIGNIKIRLLECDAARLNGDALNKTVT